ncbi:MAG: hypothetical protein OEY77_00490 [Nitrospira sp.]|nr:hypothetical protein [Nitrospira sp.]
MSLCLLLWPAPGFGEDPVGGEYQRGTREFGELLSWQNRQALDRLPTSEKLLLGFPLRRAGFTPRLTVTEVYTDNVFFTADRRSTDWITKISPGLNYLTSGHQGHLSVDYSFESRIYSNNTDENTAFSRHNGEVFGLWNMSNRTTMTLFNRFESFQDPTEQQTPGVLGTFGRTSINIGAVMLKHRLSSSLDLLASYGNFLWSVDRPGAVNSMTHEGEVGLRLRETQRGRTTAKYRFRFFDFQRGRDFQAHSGSLGHEIQVSETLVINGVVGVIGVQPNPSTIDVLAQASIKKSFENGLYEVGYVRDVFPPSGGLSQPIVGDFVRASAKVRLVDSVHFDAGLVWILSNTSSNDFTVHTLKWNVGISYSPTSWLVTRVGYDMFDQREDILGTSADRLANRVSLRMTATY